jgi:hypothetical protein
MSWVTEALVCPKRSDTTLTDTPARRGQGGVRVAQVVEADDPQPGLALKPPEGLRGHIGVVGAPIWPGEDQVRFW